MCAAEIRDLNETKDLLMQWSLQKQLYGQLGHIKAIEIVEFVDLVAVEEF